MRVLLANWRTFFINAMPINAYKMVILIHDYLLLFHQSNVNRLLPTTHTNINKRQNESRIVDGLDSRFTIFDGFEFYALDFMQ